jgi:hypothetical protein
VFKSDHSKQSFQKDPDDSLDDYASFIEEFLTEMSKLTNYHWGDGNPRDARVSNSDRSLVVTEEQSTDTQGTDLQRQTASEATRAPGPSLATGVPPDHVQNVGHLAHEGESHRVRCSAASYKSILSFLQPYYL